MILGLLSAETGEPQAISPKLAARLRARDREAWDRLVEDEHARIFNLHLRLTGDREAAADLTQDSFRSAFESAHTWSGKSAPRAWLYGVALNVSRNWMRREGRHEPPDEVSEDLPDPEPTAEETALLRERRELVLAAVRRLPEPYRRVVALRYFAGLSAVEIAAGEGVEPSTVRWRLHEASTRLWALLAPGLGEESNDETGHGELRIAP